MGSNSQGMGRTAGPEFFKNAQIAMKGAGEDKSTNDLLVELVAEVRGIRLELVRQRWLPDDLAMLIRAKLDESN